MPLPESDNGSAGSQLGNFYDWNRILRTQTDDGFWVHISGPGGAPPQPPAVDPATVGRINGSVLQASRIDTMTDAQLAAELSDMSARHMTTVVLDSVADSHNLATGTATAEYPTPQPGYTQITHTDVVNRLLGAAYTAHLRVLVGLPTDDQWHSQWANNATWLQNAAATDTAFADELWSEYSVWSNFDGWYLPLTVDNVHFGTTSAQTNLVNFYNSVTGELRTISGDRQVTTAPSFDAANTTLAGWQNATAYAAMWQSILPQVDLDVVALQDGVGDQHATAAALGPWFSAMSSAVNAAASTADLYADTQTYLHTPEGTTVPMGVKTVVADLNAAEPSIDYTWSTSYGDYLSPNSAFGTATGSYAAAYAAWATNGTGDGSDGGAPPTTPGSVTATAIDSQTVKVNWSASTDPALPIAGYTVIRNGSPVATLIGTATAFTDGQLIGSTAYTYKIQAFDGAGNTSASGGNVTATTPATPAAATDYARCAAASGHAGCHYTTTVPADPAQPDTGGTSLIDGVLGTATLGSSWQGRNSVNAYTFTVDLGTTKTFTQIKTDWLQLRQDCVWDSYYLPASLTYAVSTDGVTWQPLSTTSTQPYTNATTQTETYKALGLNATAHYIKITVNAGPGWSGLDEIQIYGT